MRQWGSEQWGDWIRQLSFRGARFAFWLVLLLSAVQCRWAKKQIEERTSTAASARAADPGRPATEAEAAKFASELQSALQSQQGLGSLVDGERIVERAGADLDLPLAQARGAAQGFSKKFSDALQRSLQRGGTYKLMANRLVGQERRVKFRLLDPEGAFNYNDYVVVTRGKKSAAEDIHVLVAGEAISMTLRRVFLPLAAENKRGLIERLTTKERGFLEQLPLLKQMSQWEANPKGALAAYASLPEPLKLDKNCLLMRTQAARILNDDAVYIQAMEDFRRAFPNDVAQLIMSLDYLYLKKRYQELLDQVTTLERVSGPDAHLNVIRAGVQYELADVPAAREELRSALQREPDLAEAVTLAIALDLAANDEAGALLKIRDAQQRQVDLSALKQNETYTAFMARADTRKKLTIALTKPSP